METIWEEGKCIRKVKTDLISELASKLSDARANVGLTQKQLSERTGIYQADISKIERGIGNPSISTLQRLADGMGMNLIIEDGSTANVEMQKIGYAFPGQRTSCYSADLLLRQYQRVKTNMKPEERKFSYRQIKDVYTIILFDKSPQEFKSLPDQYIHRGRVRFDTKLKIHMPQEYIYIPLDIFREALHNRGIVNELDAWLTFLCEEEPEMIEKLICKYPYFRDLYNEVYKLCENLEDIMGYFTEALQEMDRNTVQYMIEEQQEEIEKQQSKIEEQQGKIEELEAGREKDKAELSQKDEEIRKKDALIAELMRNRAVSGGN